MEKLNYIQIGVTALREVTGEFLESTPIYVKTNKKIKKTEMTEDEEYLIHDISGLFKEKYINLTKQENKEVRK